MSDATRLEEPAAAWNRRYAARTERMQASEIRELLKLLDEPDIISFAGGIPDPALFPVAAIQAAYDAVLGQSREATHALQYSVSEGYRPLREWLVRHMAAMGVNCTVDNVVITSGSQQALDFLGKLFLGAGDTALVTAPTYLGALQAFNPYQPRYDRLLPEGNQTPTALRQAAERAGSRLGLAYVVADFANPSGETLGRAARERLLDTVAELDIPLIEDAAYRQLRYDGVAEPPLLALDIARVIVFCSFTFMLGLFAFGALVFLLFPLEIPARLGLPFASTRPLGVLFACVVLAYWSANLVRKTPLRVWALSFPVTGWRLAGAQVLVASLDWALAGTTLYALLPHGAGLALPHFLAVFILAQVAGIASQVPGGLGVFETVVVLLLAPVLKAPDVVAALLAFRGVYYFCPLAVATAMMGAREAARKRQALAALASAVGQWTSGAVPAVMAALTFVSGASLLFSGATPDAVWHARHPASVVPLSLVEVSHFAGSVAGVWLLVLAKGIRRRLDAAYLLTVLMLALGAAVSMLKGFVYHEALALLGVLAALVVALAIAAFTAPGRRVKGFLAESQFELRKVVWPTRDETVKTTLVIIVVVIILSLLLGLIDWILKSIVLDWLLKL
jgi:preprotein translocase SecE subunit